MQNLSLRRIGWPSIALVFCLSLGCKSLETSFGKSKNPFPESVAVPGTGEWSSSNKLKDPEKVHLAYARWQEKIQQTQEARTSYQKVLDLNPKSLDAMLGLARLDQLNNRYAAAEQHLIKADSLYPNDARVIAAYGLLYAQQKDWPKATESLRKAMEMSPNDKVYQYELGVVLARSGDMNGAFSVFEMAVGTPEAHFNLAHIYHEQGNRNAAVQHLQQCLKQKPDLRPAQMLASQILDEQDGVNQAGHQTTDSNATPQVRQLSIQHTPPRMP